MTRETDKIVPGTGSNSALADRLCDWLKRKKLETPATFCLEIHRPLMPLAWPAAVVCGTFLAPFFGPDYYDRIEALRDPTFLDSVLNRLEKRPGVAPVPTKGAAP